MYMHFTVTFAVAGSFMFLHWCQKTISYRVLWSYTSYLVAELWITW